ncbi:hypothetical protein GCM10010271_55370 [Streptomyces kurssanovii]|nr:hypothetical protein GCM10010271_55370 [Streptomyces kurssanovii]
MTHRNGSIGTQWRGAIVWLTRRARFVLTGSAPDFRPGPVRVVPSAPLFSAVVGRPASVLAMRPRVVLLGEVTSSPASQRRLPVEGRRSGGVRAPSGWSGGRTAQQPCRSSADKPYQLPGPGAERAVLAACLGTGAVRAPLIRLERGAITTIEEHRCT